MYMSASLRKENITGIYDLPVRSFGTKPLRLGVAAIFGRTNALFVGKKLKVYLKHFIHSFR